MPRRLIPVSAAPPLPPALKLSTDRKTCSDAQRDPHKGWRPIPNAFGLGRESCEGRTPFCEKCYAENVERRFPAVGRLMANNYAAVENYRGDAPGLTRQFLTLLDESAALQRRAGVDRVTFRWQWDGDLAHDAHAQAIARAHDARPDILGWLYTRRLDLVHRLRIGDAPPENLAVFLSVDRWNAAKARQVADRYPWVRLAFCGDSWDECRDIARGMKVARGLRCPELVGRIPLVTDDGRGACTACAYCHPTTRGHVAFSTTKGNG